MLYHKTGFPEEGEIVMCTVTSVQYNSVFAELDEYGKTGMLHISEVSPGRIRNIRDYVVEGKKIVCKVLKVHMDRGHIDLSLRRVSDGQRRRKVNQLKKEQVCEKIIEFVAKNVGKDTKALYKDIIGKTEADYDGLSELFNEITKDEYDISNLGLDKKTEKSLLDTIKQRIKPEMVEIKGELSIVSYAPDGVDVVRDAIKEAEKVEGDFKIRYKGAGKFNIEIIAEDYKIAENVLKGILERVEKKITAPDGEMSFARKDKKG